MQNVVDAVRKHTDLVPEIALVLGSGLGDLAEAAEDAVTIPTTDLPGYPASTVAGHQGRLVFGRLEGRAVVFVQGRVHLYEGHATAATVFPVRLVHALGARRLLVTNAAGGINASFKPGTLMFITDHINLSFQNPLVGPDPGDGPRFPDMTEAYSKRVRDLALVAAGRERIDLHEGVYAAVLGPSYETPAEIRFLRTAGADLVGMPTVVPATTGDANAR
mgnify:CR=1 FL=1